MADESEPEDGGESGEPQEGSDDAESMEGLDGVDPDDGPRSAEEEAERTADDGARAGTDGDESEETDGDDTRDEPEEMDGDEPSDVDGDADDEPGNTDDEPGETSRDGATGTDDNDMTGGDEGMSESEEPSDDDVPGGDERRREAKTDGEGMTDGEGIVDDLPASRDEPDYPDPDDDIGGISTPPDDEEMPLADHIEEMILRAAVVLLVGSAATAIGLLWASQAIDLIWGIVFPPGVDEPPHVYHPLELWLTRIKVAALLGILVALPVLVYQSYLFMRPGLYPHERRYYLAAVPTSLVLAALGMLFSFFAVLPALFYYFTFYAEDSALIAYALGETFNLVLTLTGFLAIVFQIPIFIMLAIMMGVTTRQWLTEKRLYFWAAFGGLSFLFTADPTMMAPVLVALVMIALFEGTLLLLKWTGR